MNHEKFSTLDQQTCDTPTTNPETDQQPTDKQTTATTTSSTSSTSRARARAREDSDDCAVCDVCASTSRARARAREERVDTPELPPIERLRQTRDIYEANIGRMNPQVGRAIERFLLAGMELEVIEEAIGETGWARRPSANYLMAILRRYVDAEIFTLDDLITDRARHEAEKEARRARRAARWYDEDEPDPIWF